MNRKKEFGDGVFFTISNYIYWFLLANFYFWILNIPLIIVMLSMIISGDYSLNILLFLVLLPMGPALTALFSIMGKLTREGDINVTRDFFKAYKSNFFESLFFWSIEIIIMLIFWTDIKITNGNSSLYYLGIFPRCMLFICMGLTFYMFPILSRFYLKRKDVFKLSIIYLFKKIYVGIFFSATIFMIWFMLSKISGAVIILFFVSIMGYLVMYFEKGMLKEIEENLKQCDNLAE